MPALAQRPRGLPLEVDDHEVRARPQHLAEVEVAMDADPHALDPRGAKERIETLEHLALALEQLLGALGLGEPGPHPAQHA